MTKSKTMLQSENFFRSSVGSHWWVLTRGVTSSNQYFKRTQLENEEKWGDMDRQEVSAGITFGGLD